MVSGKKNMTSVKNNYLPIGVVFNLDVIVITN